MLKLNESQQAAFFVVNIMKGKTSAGDGTRPGHAYRRNPGGLTCFANDFGLRGFSGPSI